MRHQHRLFYNAGDIALALRELGPTGNKAEAIVKVAAELTMEMLDCGGTWPVRAANGKPGVLIVERLSDEAAGNGR